MDCDGICLKVFVAGNEPKLRLHTEAATSPSVMRGVHSHFTYEIFFVTSGRMELITEERTLSFERETVIVPPGEKHYSVSRGSGSYCLLFEPQGTGDRERLSELKNKLAGGVCAEPISDDECFYIERLAEKLSEMGRSSEEDAQHLAALLFSSVMRRLVPINPDSAPVFSGDPGHIAEIDGFINGNLNNRITVSDIAEYIHLSPRQLSRIVRREYGCTVSELIVRKKLSVAEMLLRNTKLRVSEIAQRVSVGAENYFYSLFASHYGMTPLKYRAMLQGEGRNITEGE